MKHVVSIGGGLSSTLYLPELLIKKYGPENVTLLMARLPNEDPDLWRLCSAVEQALGVPITYIGLDLTPWDIFFRERYLGNSRIDPCSKYLKREVLKRYLREHFDPADTTLYVGITWDEVHRLKDISQRWGEIGFQVEAPLVSEFHLTRKEQLEDCQARFGFVPRLYKWGFAHNNCGGACIKAGLREWARLLWYLPEVFAWWQENEQRFIAEIGAYTILREERNGERRYLTLKEFRERCLNWWSNCLPGTPFELLPRVKELTPSSPCIACQAA